MSMRMEQTPWPKPIGWQEFVARVPVFAEDAGQVTGDDLQFAGERVPPDVGGPRPIEVRSGRYIPVDAPDPAWVEPPPYRVVKDAPQHPLNAGAVAYTNGVYRVTKYPPKEVAPGVAIVHLSFSRVDRGAAVDWRDKQHLKNQLAGRECEAVELFPAESRLVDTANQFHLWCLAKPGETFGVGFDEGRFVTDERIMPGVTQRPGSGASPADDAAARAKVEGSKL